MEVRPIREEEALDAEHIVDVCMRFEPGRDPLPSENEEMATLAAFDDDGVMTSVVHSKPYLANYWGNYVGMSGVGEVSTLPEHRYKGHMRKLLELLLKESYKQGDLLSSLYPFSHHFYRKCGYENGPALNSLEAELSEFKIFPPIGTVKPYVPGSDYSLIAEIYEDFSAARNFACLRSEKNWADILDHDPYQTHIYSYLWFDDQNEAQGYFSLEHAMEGPKKFYVIRDYAYRTPQAFRGMLGFIGRLTHSGRPIRILLPDEINPFALFPEPYNIRVTRSCRGMVRVVNVRQCLEMYPFAAPVSFTVRAEDPVIEENNGVFRVSNEGAPENEDACNQVDKLDADAEPPDLICSIQSLSLLLTGAADLGELLTCREDIRVQSRLQPLLQAFHPGMSWLHEDF